MLVRSRRALAHPRSPFAVCRQLFSSGAGLGLAALLAVGCTEPKFDPSDRDAEEPREIDGEDASTNEDARTKEDARVPSRADAGDAGTMRPPNQKPPNDAEVSRRDPDASAAPPASDAGDARVAVIGNADGAVLLQSEPAADGSCTFTGMYSFRAEMEVSWQGRTVSGFPLIRPGTGKTIIYGRLDADGSIASMLSRIAVCGVEFPDFVAGDERFLSERYAFYIPNEAWESPRMPRWDALWTRGCDVARPGCKLSELKLDATLGAASLLDPPEVLTSLAHDHDRDGHPGVTVRTRTPEESARKYSRVPVAFSTNERSESLFSAVVFAAQFDGVLTDCDTVRGTLVNPRVAIQALGCLVRATDGASETPCSPDHVSFIANNVPQVTATSGTFEGRRIRPGADCAAVRSVWADETNE